MTEKPIDLLIPALVGLLSSLWALALTTSYSTAEMLGLSILTLVMVGMAVLVWFDERREKQE
jgi:hypothetical protein